MQLKLNWYEHKCAAILSLTRGYCHSYSYSYDYNDFDYRFSFGHFVYSADSLILQVAFYQPLGLIFQLV